MKHAGPGGCTDGPGEGGAKVAESRSYNRLSGGCPFARILAFLLVTKPFLVPSDGRAFASQTSLERRAHRIDRLGVRRAGDLVHHARGPGTAGGFPDSN